MRSKKHAVEQIVGKFREAEVELGKHLKVEQKMCCKWAGPRKSSTAGPERVRRPCSLTKAGGSNSRAENARLERRGHPSLRRIRGVAGARRSGLPGPPQLMRPTAKISLRQTPLIYLTSLREVCYTAQWQIAVVR